MTDQPQSHLTFRARVGRTTIAVVQDHVSLDGHPLKICQLDELLSSLQFARDVVTEVENREFRADGEPAAPESKSDALQGSHPDPADVEALANRLEHAVFGDRSSDTDMTVAARFVLRQREIWERKMRAAADHHSRIINGQMETVARLQDECEKHRMESCKWFAKCARLEKELTNPWTIIGDLQQALAIEDSGYAMQSETVKRFRKILDGSRSQESSFARIARLEKELAEARRYAQQAEKLKDRIHELEFEHAPVPLPPVAAESQTPLHIIRGAIATARESFRNDGAEGETVHLLCDALEKLLAPPVPVSLSPEAIEKEAERMYVLGTAKGADWEEEVSGCKNAWRRVAKDKLESEARLLAREQVALDAFQARSKEANEARLETRKMGEHANAIAREREELRAQLSAALERVKELDFIRLCSETSCKALRDKLDAALERVKELEGEREQLEVQLAGCGVAALGWSRGEQKAKPGDYGWSASYGDVVKLRERMEATEAASNEPPVCRGCCKPLLGENFRIADGCPCNSPRGVNHGLVSKNTCTCEACDPEQTGSTRYAHLTPQTPAWNEAQRHVVGRLVIARMVFVGGVAEYVNEIEQAWRDAGSPAEPRRE